MIAKPVTPVDIQRELQTLRRPSIDNVQDHELTRLMEDNFSFEKLQQVIFQNKNQISYILDHSTKTHSFHNLKQVRKNFEQPVSRERKGSLC